MAIMVTVGFTFLSAFLQVLFDRLASRTFINFLLGNNNESVYDQLKNLKVLLLSVNAAINNAEEKQLGDTAVREWLSELEEVIFEADFLVDEINTKALADNTNQVLGFLRGTAQKIEKMMARLEFIVRQKDLLGLQESDRSNAPRPTPFEDESSVYGRDEDKQRILEMLRADESPVISIVGMGGIGKTTLAQLVYNDDEVKRTFHHRAWITVSEDFDVFKLTKAVLEAVTCQRSNIQYLYPLQVQLDLAIREKKFLFVLDDVWNENYVLWSVLKSPLESGAHGSKIILTTRSEKAALMMSNASTHRLRELSVPWSRSLFVKHAFEDGDTTLTAYPDLSSVADQVVNKCKGLPLAIKSLGGLLRCEVDVEEWKKVLTNDIWELSEIEHNILPALWLSYCHLPPYIRRCFAYCSIFPKSYKMNKEQLVLMWMAEDLLLPQSGRRIEDIGEEYVASLVSKSLLQNSGDEKTVTMHDLVHDMATFVSRRSCRSLDSDDSVIFDRKTRYLSFKNGSISASEGVLKFESVLSNNQTLRSFLPFGKTKFDTTRDNITLASVQEEQRLRSVSLSTYNIPALPRPIGNLKYLRYFDISYSKFKKMPAEIGTLLNLQTLLLKSCSSLAILPTSIGKLKQLRYLDLSFTALNSIPDEISELSNLQTLLLANCKKLKQLPPNMARLTGLRHLDISNTECLEQMPPKMSSLKGLRILTDFVVGHGTGSRIEELGELQDIQGSLEISRLENVVVPGVAQTDTLRGKKHLSKLSMKWNSHNDETELEKEKEKEVLVMLQPHKNLKELSIELYNGGSFPTWVGDGSFSNIVRVSLIDCKHCSSLPPLGQLPSLEYLYIIGFNELKTVGGEFYSDGAVTEPFRSLKALHFENMPKWLTWSLFPSDRQDEAFPRLKQLYLVNCRRLSVNLPNRLEDIKRS